MMIDNAETLEELKIPPVNRLEALKGDRSEQYSIHINDQFRIGFEYSKRQKLRESIEQKGNRFK